MNEKLWVAKNGAIMSRKTGKVVQGVANIPKGDSQSGRLVRMHSAIPARLSKGAMIACEGFIEKLFKFAEKGE